jgi:hypothetical protein
MPARLLTITFEGTPPRRYNRAAQDEQDSARMKQARETAAHQPTGASFLSDTQPLADGWEGTNSLSAAVQPGEATAGANVVVGGKNFTEQQLLAEMTTELLQAKGFTVTKKDGLGSAVLRAAQENGQVDVYWEYTGTSLITYNKINDRLSPEDTLR